MTARIAPTAPDSLPKYLADGIPKQDIATLEDMQDYIAKMIEHKRRPAPESEIPDDAEVVETDEGGTNGTVYIRKNTCGDETCHCMTDGDLHGPYKYLVYRDGNGTVVTDYQGKV